MRRAFGRCAMVARRMGGDFVSTFRGVFDNSMDHGEVPNIFFPKPGRREHAGLAEWSQGSQDRMGGERIGAGGLRGTRIVDRSWRPTRVAGLAGWHADRSWAARRPGMVGAGGLHNGGACIGAGPDGWNLAIGGPTQKVIACVSRGKSSPQRLFLKSMRH